MDYFDLLRDLASEEGEIEDETKVTSILNGARDRLDELESQVQERLPDGEDEDAGEPDLRKSEISRSERADLYEKWREEGKDPNEEWDKLPE